MLKYINIAVMHYQNEAYKGWPVGDKVLTCSMISFKMFGVVLALRFSDLEKKCWLVVSSQATLACS